MTKKFGAILIDAATWTSNTGSVCSFYEYSTPPVVPILSSCARGG
jgi:hypothetical protein